MNYTKHLQKIGLKATIQRILILESIGNYGHFNIDTIYQKAKERNKKLSLATVYKNIATLVDKNILTEVPILGEKPKYEITKEEHIHLICNICGNIEDKPLKKEILENSNFLVESHQLNIYGTCILCQKGDFNE